MSAWPPLETKELPVAPHWTRAIGVGVVVVGMAMGTGELILWPHMTTRWGLEVLWFALVGIIIQYFINQEVARHTLATGESFFTSASRKLRYVPIFFLLSAVILYIWPAWATALGTIVTHLIGFGNYKMWAWISLALVLVITYRGKVAYTVLENSLKVTVPLFTLLLIVISFFNLSPSIVREAIRGVFSFGYIPSGVDWSVLLGAVVFAGAGGMLNLCVSLWYRDKQMGMSHYVGRIANPISGRPEAVAVTGYTFSDTKENISKFKKWMRYVYFDQGVVFLGMGLLSLLLLAVNAYAVLAPLGIVPTGLNLVVEQAKIFGNQWGSIGETIYLVMAYLMLFSVMWTVLDALTRMVTDIVHTNARVGYLQKLFAVGRFVSVHHLYYGLMTLFVIVGSLLVPFQQPITFLLISSALGGIVTAFYMPILIYLNNKMLPRAIRPGIITNVVLIAGMLFYWFFAFQVVRSLF